MSADSFRILVADDEQAVLDAYRTVVEDINPPFARRSTIEDLEAKLFGEKLPSAPAPTFSPVLVRRGEEAVETIRTAREGDQTFPVVFLDVRMPPGIDGIETAARIRAIDPEVNIVIVTGYSDTPLNEIARRVPPLDKLFYISKPFQKMELQQFVFALTAKWRADRAARLLNEQLNEQCRQLRLANAAIEKERERADAANHAKSEFLAKMSHELRTPLNAVIGFADVMRAGTYGEIGNERYRRYLEDITFSGNHLLSMINDLLDISTIDVGMLKVHAENVDLDEVVSGVTSLMRIHADSAKVELKLDHRAQHVTLTADERRLRQVLVNLLGNAIKFTSPEGRVVMTTRIDREKGLKISVSDTGIGISPEDIASVFAPFHQVDHGNSRRYDGAGLGLTIAKNLSELMGGKLEVESELGKGTIVTLHFPTGRCTSKETPAAGIRLVARR
ncbi:MAG TPA: ATP-binding protein [Dongiaceae bacterium]|nr:ATP-binding protein [Dongiaceae bacterium]